MKTWKLFESDYPTGCELSTDGDGEGFRAEILGQGKSAGLQQVTLKSGDTEVDVLPGRGMGIHSARCNGTKFGWSSPVDGPVHPSLVPVEDSSGIGWLEGFDEMVVRCGLLSNGAPQFDNRGNVVYPVHGRIANLPATDVSVTLDETENRISVTGTVHEARFLIYKLTLKSTIVLSGNRISIEDTVTNSSGRPASFQLLYHNNFGKPVIGNGATFKAPVVEVAPRDSMAARGIDDWQNIGPPEPGFAEQVYFMHLANGSNGKTPALLMNGETAAGVLLQYDGATLPCFTLWKNTAAIEDGYVCGIEPATNFPNTRQFEEEQGRIVELEPGESRDFKLTLELLTTRQQLDAASALIDGIDSRQTLIHRNPRTGWSPE